MKSYVDYLKGLYTAISSDIVEYLPILRRDCDRDLSRLLSLVESRGLPFLMIDLAEAGKHFDMCLAAGLLTRFDMTGLRSYRKGGVIPRLFKGLLLRVFHENGVLRLDPDITSIRFLRMLFYAAKKVKVKCEDSKTWEHVNEFFKIEQEVRPPSLSWDGDELGTDRIEHLHIGDVRNDSPAPLLRLCDANLTDDEESFFHTYHGLDDVVQRTADIVSATVGGFEPSEWRTKHGPGAVTDQRRTQYKYDFPNWPAKLESVFPMAVFGFANYSHWASFSTSNEVERLFRAHEPPSKLIAVPKSLKGPRLIAAEPVSHQWCQQSILNFLASRLAMTPIASSIRFSDQGANGRLALRASLTQSHATIDLSSASDRLSCWLVERIFRRNDTLLKALHATRTRWVVNTIDRLSPRYHVLKKFACQGSACTFPIQSYVFTILATATVLYVRNLKPSIKNLREISKEVQVYGDDIIVPIDSWEVLQGLLGHLGLKVNAKKTFGIGKFRESCGVDAYDGHDVTPTYSMTYPDVTRPESIVSLVATTNNLLDRGFHRAAEYTKSTVRKQRRIAIANVPMGSGSFGWHDLYAEGNLHLKKRWNPNTQQVEHLVDTICIVNPRIPTDREAQLLQYFTEVRPVPFIEGDRIGPTGKPLSKKLRKRWVTLPV